METVRKINNDLAIAGQIVLEQLPELIQAGFRSVLNLRMPSETGFLSNEQQQAEHLGLYYLNLPISLQCLNDETALKLFNQIYQLPKPSLIHCDCAVRSSVIVLLYIATQQGISLEQAFKQVEQLGLLNFEPSTRLATINCECS